MGAKHPNPIANPADTPFEQYRPELQRFLVRRLHGTQDAGDLAQEVYLRLLRVEEPGLVRKPLAYLYRIAANVIYEYRIREQQEPVTFDSEAVELLAEHPENVQPDELGEQLNTERQLEHVLAKLPPLQRAILLMQKRDGMSYAEIAEQLSLSVHTVEKYLFRALAIVRATKWAP